jgi:hypothetical protein
VAWRALKIVITTRPFDWKYFAYVQEFIVGTVGLVLLILACFKVRPSLSFFALASFLLPTLTGTFSSLPRYYLTTLTPFLFLAIATEKSKWRSLLMAISLVLLGINTVLFLQGYWVA